MDWIPPGFDGCLGLHFFWREREEEHSVQEALEPEDGSRRNRIGEIASSKVFQVIRQIERSV